MSESTWRQARASLCDRELIEVCLLFGHYQGLSSAIRGLAIQPETAGEPVRAPIPEEAKVR